MTLRNPNITTPEAAWRVMKELDFGYFQHTKIPLKLTWYVQNGKREITSNHTIRFQGYARAESEKWMGEHSGWKLIKLPTPRYYSNDTTYNDKHFFPCELLTGSPRAYEFVLFADKSEDYDGLQALVEKGFPALMEAGYVVHDANHSSIFWLHAGKNLVDRISTVMYSSAHGLEICAEPARPLIIDDNLVLTATSIERLLRLNPTLEYTPAFYEQMLREQSQ